jgi:hypothetical protein
MKSTKPATKPSNATSKPGLALSVEMLRAVVAGSATTEQKHKR